MQKLETKIFTIWYSVTFILASAITIYGIFQKEKFYIAGILYFLFVFEKDYLPAIIEFLLVLALLYLSPYYVSILVLLIELKEVLDGRGLKCWRTIRRRRNDVLSSDTNSVINTQSITEIQQDDTV